MFLGYRLTTALSWRLLYPVMVRRFSFGASEFNPRMLPCNAAIICWRYSHLNPLHLLVVKRGGFLAFVANPRSKFPLMMFASFMAKHCKDARGLVGAGVCSLFSHSYYSFATGVWVGVCVAHSWLVLKPNKKRTLQYFLLGYLPVS